MLSCCSDNAEDRHDRSLWKRLFLGAMTGTAFGFLLDKGKMNVPLAIVDQMGMRNFCMMRFFLSACASSILSLSLLDWMGWKPRRVPGGIRLGTGIKGPLSGYGANVIGGALLGAGMAITGSCPGTVWTQVGARMPYTSSIIAGGVIGTIAYGYFHSYLKYRRADFSTPSSNKTLDGSIGISYPFAGICVVGALLGVVKIVESLSPWVRGMSELLAPSIQPSTSIIPDPTAVAWDPMLCGCLLGVLQIPASMSNGKGLGSSSGWVTMGGFISHALDKNGSKNAPYFESFRSIWQVGGAFGMVLGSWLSNYLSGSGPEIYSAAGAAGVGSHASAFFGGAILLFGARLAGGCPSGHGLTGMGTLAFSSFATVAGMFAGGMGVRMLPTALRS